MSKTIKTYLGEVGRTVYPVDFTLGYLDRTHVFVYAGEVPTEQLTYTWVNDSQIELSTPYTTGKPFVIRRIVPRTVLLNDYENGAILEESNLDDSFKQSLMILEEVEDGLHENGMQLLTDIQMNGNRILGLPQPLSSEEPVRKLEFDSLLAGLTEFPDASQFAVALADHNSVQQLAGIEARALRVVPNLKSLLAIPYCVMNVLSFYTGASVGGGRYVYDATRSKLDHDGVAVISPEAIAVWDGTPSGLATLLNWVGFGTGVFVRLDTTKTKVNLETCGAFEGNNISFIVNHCYEKGYETVVVPIGNFYVEGTITIPHDKHIVGGGSTKTILNLRASMVDTVVLRYGQNYFYQGYRGSIKNIGIHADGNFAKRGIGVLFNSGCEVEDVAMFELKAAFVLVGNNYTDMIRLTRCYVGYCGGHPTYNVIHLDGPGDALHIDQLVFQLSYNLAEPVSSKDGVLVSRFRGGTMSSCILNGHLTIARCDAMNITAHHMEGSQNDTYKTNMTSIKIRRSNVSIDGLYVHKAANGPTIKFEKEIVGSSHETSSASLKNITIDTTILLKADLAGSDIADIELDGNSIVNIENVYRQETYAFAQTQPKTGIKINGSPAFNKHSSILSKKATIHPNGKVSNGVEIVPNGVDVNYNRNQFSNSNPNIPFYEPAAAGKTFYIRTVLVVDSDRMLATNRNSVSQQVNNVTTGDIGVGRGILVNTVNSPLTDGLGATVFYYRGEAANMYNKVAKAPVVLCQFTYDTGFDYNGYMFESRVAADIDEFTYVDDYKVDMNGKATFTCSKIPTIGTFSEGDKVINSNISDWTWRTARYTGGQWVNVENQLLLNALAGKFGDRYAPYFNGTTSFGEFSNRLINPDNANIQVKFKTGQVTLGRSQAIVAQQATTDPASREFLLVANTNDTIGIHLGGVSVTTVVSTLKPHTAYTIDIELGVVKVYENDVLMETRVFVRGAAREPAAKTTVGAAYTSGATRLLFFAGQLFDVTIDNVKFPMDNRNATTQLASTPMGTELELNFITSQNWASTN